MTFRSLIEASLSSSPAIQNRFIQLATLSTDQARPCARVRTVVMRGWTETRDFLALPALDSYWQDAMNRPSSHCLVLHSDVRGGKVADIAANPQVEICWYFGDQQKQFRIQGLAKVCSLAVLQQLGVSEDTKLAALLLHQWNGLSRQTRTLYAQAVDEKTKSVAATGDFASHPRTLDSITDPGINNFSVILVLPTRVELLDLLSDQAWPVEVKL
ncbi:hypothetical protein HDV03_000577 [Kappamyces sp. JEL0829]|nr:hypothetical protein HDV03_000577 [Kappamyces sp. JEL0829]